LAQVIDWAQSGTISTLFSGPAATAAVLHLDGIAHRTLPEPLLGVYGSSRTEDDPLFFNSASSMPVPHARRCELGEDDLTASGYRVLAQLENGQVDIFARETAGQSRFVFLQGHPEFDPATLARLHLKEMERFQAERGGKRPALPEHYFDRATETRLAQLAFDLPAYRGVLASALPCQAWHSHAARLFGNWLMLVAAAKARRVSSKTVTTRRRAS
jgi:homoserine O-succinyltransferase